MHILDDSLTLRFLVSRSFISQKKSSQGERISSDDIDIFKIYLADTRGAVFIRVKESAIGWNVRVNLQS